MKKKRILLLCLLSLLLTACTAEKHTIENDGRLRVVTSFYPMYLLAQAVTEGADGLELVNMAQPQTGCLHDYELTISDMKLLEGADVLIVNGGGMESFLEQAMEQYPQLTVIDTSEGIDLLEEEHHHHGEDADEHDHAEGNPHLWLSPKRAAQQAENMAAALSGLDTADAAILSENAADFRTAALLLEQEAEAAEIPAGEFAAVFHEGFPYLAELFGMETASGIFADEYQMPSAKELAEAAEEAKEHHIRFFLTAADNGEIYAETLAREADGSVLVLDPLTTADAEGLSYLERMEKNIEAIRNYGRERAR